MGSGMAGSETSGSGAKLQWRNSPGTRRAWVRWLPAVAVPAVIAGGVLAGTIPASARDPLPEKTPAEVLALMASHKDHTFSGTIEQSSDLGLPELPAGPPASGPASAGGAASVFELLAGGHTARVHMDGKTKVRIQVVDRLAERDIVRRDNDLWFYSSKDNSTAHLTLPAFASDLPLAAPEKPMPQQPEHPQSEPEAPPQKPPVAPLPEPPLPGTPPDAVVPPAPDDVVLPTPVEIAEHFLAKVDPTTAVSVGDDVTVAGRTAYNLLLKPRTDATLVGSVAVAVDGETGMPLSVQITARGAASPSFSAAFESLSLEAPDDALFNFTPPPGSTVKELQLPNATGWPLSFRTPGMIITPDHLTAIREHPAHPSVTGKGWEAVVEIPAAAAGGTFAESLLRDPLLSQAAVVVPGGRLLSTTLFNVLITDDGRLFAGMVPADALQAAASTQ
jgi:outer membrane lipoprotein-sorting protein